MAERIVVLTGSQTDIIRIKNDTREHSPAGKVSDRSGVRQREDREVEDATDMVPRAVWTTLAVRRAILRKSTT